MRQFGHYSQPLLREMAFLLPPLSGYRRAAAKALLASVRAQRPGRVLEVGCGTGFLSRRLGALLPESEILSLDFSPAMIETARKRRHPPNVFYRVGDFYEIGGVYDAVVVFHAFVLFDFAPGLAKLAELTGGAAHVTLTGRSLFTRLHRRIHRRISGLDVNLVEPERFARLAQSAGFGVQLAQIHPSERSYLCLLNRGVRQGDVDDSARAFGLVRQKLNLPAVTNGNGLYDKEPNAAPARLGSIEGVK